MSMENKKQKNVLGEILEECSIDPLTGWYRDGCCNTDENDHGLHTVCVKVTDEFLKWFEVIKAQGKVRCIGLAGEPESIMPWLHSNHLEFSVIQTRDGFKEEESVDLMTKTGYRPQFTYGYISSNKSPDVKAIMKKAFLRNRSGSIIISTRRKERLAVSLHAATNNLLKEINSSLHK